MSTVHLRWQKIVNELKYLYSDLNYIKAMAVAAGPEFQEYYGAFCKRHNIDLDELNRQNQERIAELYNETSPGLEPPPLSDSTEIAVRAEDAQEESDEFERLIEEAADERRNDEIHAAFYKVFKKLAMKLHPDRQPPNTSDEQKEKNMQLFKEANEALNERRYYGLLELALQFNIEPPTNYKEQIKWMKQEIKTVHMLINQQQGTYNYLFAECDEDDERDHLIRRFMYQVHGLNL